ncbi:MAG: homoserine O-acetyltransferase [Thermaerobacter sp.]|nr:homoserine O-acetyltransferase [Thermaerobacter sp.]
MKDETFPHPIWPWQRQPGFPWPGLRFYRAAEPFVLDSGEVLPDLCLAWEEWGDRSNPTLVVFHALTGDSHVTRHGPDDRAGWWEGVVGPGLFIDTTRWHVVAANALGGAMGSTGPSSPGPDGRPYGSRFPEVTLFDLARTVRQLLTAEGLCSPVALLGGSMGGMAALAYASQFAEDVSGVLAIASPIAHSPWAIAYHAVGRAAIRQDAAYAGGDYYGEPVGPEQGLMIARMADMISYQHPEAMERKFGRRYQTPQRDEFEVESYLAYQGRKLVRRFDANSYLVLTSAMDRFELDRAALARLRALPVWMAAIASDMLYPPDEMARQADRLRKAGVAVKLCHLAGSWGHDTFLVDQAAAGRLAQEFLAAVEARTASLTPESR